MKRVWSWLSGKKTTAGAAAMVAVAVASHLEPEIMQDIPQAAWTADALAVIGLLHKAAKIIQKYMAKK